MNIRSFISKIISKKFSNPFYLDLRALAIFRICFGFVLLIDLIFRSRNLAEHYSDYGILPRKILIENFLEPWSFSINLISGEPYVQTIIFILNGLCILAFIVGFKARFFALLCWMFLLSLMIRNPFLNDSGNKVMLAFLLLSFFLPINEKFSLESKSFSLNQKNKFFSVGTISFLLQLAFVYFFSALFKFHPVWTEERKAIQYALSNETYVSDLGRYFLKFPNLLEFLTQSTHFLEFVGPLLLFVPFLITQFRVVLILLFIGLHLSFILFLKLNLFPFVCISIWLALFPTKILDRFEKYFRKNFSIKKAHDEGINDLKEIKKVFTLNKFCVLY